MRNNQINTIVTMSDGTAYMGPGYGITANGSSAKVRLQANDKHHEFSRFEKLILEDDPDAEKYDWRVERQGDDIILRNDESKIYKLYSWIPLSKRVEQQNIAMG